VNPVISPEEGDGLLRPTQRLRWLGVDELDLTFVLAVPSIARVAPTSTSVVAAVVVVAP
jgi:hypothetical protein